MEIPQIDLADNDDTNATSTRPARRTRRSTGTRRFKDSIWTKKDDDQLIYIMTDPKSPPNGWSEIAKAFPGKDPQQVSNRWRNVLDPSIKKGSWTPEEDQFILQWVKDHGPTEWHKCAARIGGRIGKQCRARWMNQLSDSYKRTEWTPEEDRRLLEIRSQFGNKWRHIAQILGRSENQVKNRWHSTLKRKLNSVSSGIIIDIKRGKKKGKSKVNRSTEQAEAID